MPASTVDAIVAAARDAAKLRERVAELERDVTSLREIPGLVDSLPQETLHALLRWRATEGRAQRGAGRADERAAVVAAGLAEVAKYKALDSAHGQRAALAVAALVGCIERGEHVAGELEGG